MNEMTISPQLMARLSGISGSSMQKLLGGQMGDGGFMAIFEQLMNSDEELAMLMQGQQDEQENIDMAMQMMAELLFSANPQAQMLLQQLNPEQLTAISDSMKSVASQPLNVQPETMTVQQQTPQEGEEQASFEKILVQHFQTNSQAESQNNSEDLMQGQYQFRNAVLEAKQKLDGEKKGPVPELDIEALQASVNEKRFVPAAGVSAQLQTEVVDAKDVINQMKDGILNNISKGNDEFVMKLKPEGLGEITVKMQEIEGKISMSILASTPQVAKLISNEVVALQNALRPLQAQVQEVSYMAPEAAQSAASYNAFSEQSFHHQQQFSQQNHTGNSNNGSSPSDGLEEVSWNLEPEDDSLDTYI